MCFRLVKFKIDKKDSYERFNECAYIVITTTLNTIIRKVCLLAWLDFPFLNDLTQAL